MSTGNSAGESKNNIGVPVSEEPSNICVYIVPTEAQRNDVQAYATYKRLVESFGGSVDGTDWSFEEPFIYSWVSIVPRNTKDTLLSSLSENGLSSRVN